jgi:hypothetical protein
MHATVYKTKDDAMHLIEVLELTPAFIIEEFIQEEK